MRVVLPFDGSASAERAVDYVVDLAKRMDGGGVSVDLVNVQAAAVGLPGLFTRDAADLADKLTQSSIEQGARVLAEPIRRLEKENISVKSSVLVGEAAPEIASFAEDRSAEAIIMGTRGLGAVGGWVLGSVASKVVHLVKVPVTLVK